MDNDIFLIIVKKKLFCCGYYNNVPLFYARIKVHLEPTHLRSSPLFTFSTKSLGQDSPSIHLFSKKKKKKKWVKIHHRENKVGWRFTKLICFF